MEEIDNYLQILNRRDGGTIFEMDRHYAEPENEILTTTAIVESCPEFLFTNDIGGWLPIHHAARFATASSNKRFKLLLDTGCKLNLGGDEGRGGLVVSEPANHNCLNEIRDPHIFEMLRQMSPPLFCSEDVSKYCLLHNAARRGSLDTIKYFCDLDPSCLSYLYQKDRYKTIPLCIALIAPFDISTKQHQDLLQYLLQEAVSYDPSNETIGCLFTTVNILENDFLVNCIVKHFGMERTWDHP